MTSTTTMEAQPAAHAGERIIPAADNAALARRLHDLPAAYQKLEWEEETPFGPASVVYLYRLRDEPSRNWAHIKTEELLLEVKASPDRYDLWTLFTVPVDDVSRSPRAHVAMAMTRMDIINASAGAVKANLRAFLRETAEKL